MSTDRVFPCTDPITWTPPRGVEGACSSASAVLLPTVTLPPLVAPAAMTTPRHDFNHCFISTPGGRVSLPGAMPRHATDCRTTARHWRHKSCERPPGATPGPAPVHRVLAL